MTIELKNDMAERAMEADGRESKTVAEGTTLQVSRFLVGGTTCTCYIHAGMCAMRDSSEPQAIRYRTFNTREEVQSCQSISLLKMNG